MDIITRKAYGHYEGRSVPYLELLITGDKHTFSIRQYPRNTTVQMFQNSNKSGTKISYKLPNNKFDVLGRSTELMLEFGVLLDFETMTIIENRWNSLVNSNRF